MEGTPSKAYATPSLACALVSHCVAASDDVRVWAWSDAMLCNIAHTLRIKWMRSYMTLIQYESAWL